MNSVNLNPNPIVRFCGKPQSEFTKEDITKFVKENGIEMINFMYPAADGRLKTLNFVINSEIYLETILSTGERVDGSSLFPYIEASGSDLYVIPRFRTAFVDPFAKAPTLTMLCSFFDKDGQPLASAPDYTLHKACERLREKTGLEFEAMGELEYYVIAPDTQVYPATDQRGYHESAPFAKFNDFRTECMMAVARTGAQIKYGHSEVGNFTLDGTIYEQNEIEFLPVPAEQAAEHLLLAKWIIRNLAAQNGLKVTFAPKITAGKAGSGLHIHMRLMRDGKNMMLENRKLSQTARRAIAGIIDLAPALTAFGNTIPTSYFRLVPHQEAPTNVCWGDRNRSVLVRVPLGWTSESDMCAIANPGSANTSIDTTAKQTVEIRSADGSADIYALLSGLAVAMRHGLEMGEEADKIAAETYVDVDIHKAENQAKCARLAQLPTSCVASADCLEERRDIFCAEGVFSPGMIDSAEASLRRMHDRNLAAECERDPKIVKELVNRYFYCG